MFVIDSIGNLASLIGSLITVGSALLWVYNKFIGKPREERRLAEEAKRQAAMMLLVTNANKPLNKSIQQLTEWLNESKEDRKRLDGLSKVNKERIDKHEDEIDVIKDRVLVLETSTDYFKTLKKTFPTKEEVR